MDCGRPTGEGHVTLLQTGLRGAQEACACFRERWEVLSAELRGA